MAILADADRQQVWKEYQTALGANRDVVGALTKHDLKAAVDAIDAWVDANSAAFNTAIPQPARGALTTKQKAGLLTLVVQRRYQVQ
jgi:hypothetical protein